MKRILVIDDDEQIRGMICSMLECAGYAVLDAPEGNAGLRIQQANPVDLVITDIFMLGKEGIETIMDLTKEFPAIKIIAISGGASFSRMDMLPMAEMLGASGALSKPFEKKELLEMVRSLLEG